MKLDPRDFRTEAVGPVTLVNFDQPEVSEDSVTDDTNDGSDMRLVMAGALSSSVPLSHLSPIQAPPEARIVRGVQGTASAEALEEMGTTRQRLRLRKTTLYTHEQVAAINHAKRVLALALGKDLEFSDVVGLLIDRYLGDLVKSGKVQGEGGGEE